MAESVARPSSEIDVTNFGPIIDAQLKLHPMTMFVGLSNTGKTYLLMVIYALHKDFDNYLPFRGCRIHRALLSDQIRTIRMIMVPRLGTLMKF